MKNKRDINDSDSIDGLLHQIRSAYEDIKDEDPKAPILYKSFEDRYLEIIKGRSDISLFLKGEKNFVQAMVEEVQKLRDRKRAFHERYEKGYANNILSDIQDNIREYPLLPSLHRDILEEVSRLYGAIASYIDFYWQGISYFMRGIDVQAGVFIDRLERSLPDVYSNSNARPPKSLEYYNELLRMGFGSNSERTRAAQNAIQHAGVWLNNLLRILERHSKVTDKESLGNQLFTYDDLHKAIVALSQIVNHFRLGVFASKSL